MTMEDQQSPPPPRTKRRTTSSPPAPSSSCPLQLLKKQAEQNSSRIKKKKEEDDGGEETLIDDEDIINAFVVFNQDLASRRDYCVNRVQKYGSPKVCNCLQILLHLNRPFCVAVAEYQVYFASHKHEDQQKIVIDWMRSCDAVRSSNTPKNTPIYPIPFLAQPPSEEEEEEATDYGPLSRTNICRDALADLINVGGMWWNTVTKKHCKNHTPLPNHKLKGRVSNNKRKWNATFESDLIDHFEELRKEAGPIATRFVREHTGELSERDTNEEAEYLLPYWSKRQ